MWVPDSAELLGEAETSDAAEAELGGKGKEETKADTPSVVMKGVAGLVLDKSGKEKQRHGKDGREVKVGGKIEVKEGAVSNDVYLLWYRALQGNLKVGFTYVIGFTCAKTTSESCTARLHRINSN